MGGSKKFKAFGNIRSVPPIELWSSKFSSHSHTFYKGTHLLQHILEGHFVRFGLIIVCDASKGGGQSSIKSDLIKPYGFA